MLFGPGVKLEINAYNSMEVISMLLHSSLHIDRYIKHFVLYNDYNNTR